MNVKDLKIQCDQCLGLCCRALYFSKIDGFPEDKTAGRACSYLCPDSACSIYSQLKEKHLKGCMIYDCFGAGQHMSTWLRQQHTSIPNIMDDSMMDAFYKLMNLHQQLWYLKQAQELIQEHALQIPIQNVLVSLETLIALNPHTISKQDIEASHYAVNTILKKVSDHFLEAYPHRYRLNSGSYLGKSFNQPSLIGCDFSMKLLIGCDFTGCDLTHANFLGSDIRDADFSNADLRRALFLTQFQINSVKGNESTQLPAYLHRPRTWKQ